jgi:hypothetical protein
LYLYLAHKANRVHNKIAQPLELIKDNTSFLWTVRYQLSK